MQNLKEIGQFEEFNHLELIAKQVVEGFITGLHKSPYHGFSVEFSEHRLYNKGESTKHIDWKLYARTEKLFVKRYEEETNLRAQIVIDTSPSMFFPGTEKLQNKLAYSIYVSAALIYLLRRQRDALGLSLFDEELYFHARARLSSVHSAYVNNELRQLLNKEYEPSGKNTAVADSLHILAEQLGKRSLVILFSDMFSDENPDDIFSALQHLRYNKHEVLLFHVVDKEKEEVFSYRNRPYRFVDMESGREMKLNPNQVRGHYQERTQAYFNELKTRCGQYQIDLIEADIRKDFRDVLMAYLLKRSKLF